jgi:nucleoside-diphosphate-sugar epimerase
MKKILITGSSGFLGSNLIGHLAKNSKYYSVVGLDKNGPAEIVGDLCDENFVKKLDDYDFVIHCAAVQYVTKKKPLFFRKKYFYDNNVKATENLVNRYKNTNTFFVHIGTSMQYHQDGSKIYKPSSIMSSQGIYSWSKLEAQKIIDKANLKSATIIPCIIGGPGREGLFKGFVNSLSKWRVGIIPGMGNFNISIVHVNDVVSLITLIVKKQKIGYFNAASNDYYSIIDWVKFIQSTLKIKSIKYFKIPFFALQIASKISFFRVLAKEQLIMLSMPHVLDIESSRNIGWNPKKNTKDIIKDISLALIKVN